MSTALAQKQSLELKKHVGTIHSSNELSLVQRKIANALLYNAYNHLIDKDEHQLRISTLCELIGYNSKDHKKIKKALVALISTVIEWNLVDEDRMGDVWNASAVIADASIEGGVCRYSYSNKMRQLLHRPELYGRLNMQVQSRFKSTYGLALYENCIRYQNISQTPWFNMPTFRKLMGVSADKYIIFRDFKRRVLDKAIAEVNSHAPIIVTVKFQKESRQVTALQFLIKKRGKLLLGSKALSLTDKLHQHYGFSKNQIERTLSTYENEYILEKIHIIETSSTFQNGKIINLAKYLEKALEEDYQAPKTSREFVEKVNKKKETTDKLKKLKEQQLGNYRRYQDQEILKVYESLPAKQKPLVIKEFGKHIQHNMYYDLFKKQGFENVLVADRFCDFIRAYKKELLSAIMSFDDFCKSQ